MLGHLLILQIGGMFDTIQRTHSVTGDWAHILNKLIYYGKLTVSVIPFEFFVNPAVKLKRFSAFMTED